jgi:hypothetical protein
MTLIRVSKIWDVTPNHHADVWGMRHASAPGSRRSRGMCSMPRGSGICSAIAVIEVAVPLALALNGGASILVRLAAVGMRVVDGVHAAIGVHNSTGDGSGDPSEW